MSRGKRFESAGRLSFFTCKSDKKLRTLGTRIGAVAAVASPKSIPSINRLVDTPKLLRGLSPPKVRLRMEQEILAGMKLSYKLLPRNAFRNE